MLKFNYKFIFSALVIIISLFSFIYLNNVDIPNDASIKSTNNQIHQNEEHAPLEKHIFLPDFSILSQVARFLKENLPAN